ncbi:MAG: response regulator transcription factor [Bacillota bacterium]
MLIYYIENNQLLRSVIDKMIQQEGFSSVGFHKSEDFLIEFSRHKPDMILVEIEISSVSGLNILKLIREVDKDTPVVVILPLQSEKDKVVALDMGASDYIVKPFGVLELTSKIQSKLIGNIGLNIYKFGNVTIDEKKHLCMIKQDKIYLTNKEFSILKLLIKDKTDIISKESIFKAVWDTNFIGETRTLDMHIKSLRQKLKIAHATMEIKTIRGIGYQTVLTNT